MTPAEEITRTQGALRPTLVYDGECGFCRKWVARWKNLAGDALTYLPYQDLPDPHCDIPHQEFRQSLHLRRPEGSWVSGAEAVFESLKVLPEKVYLHEAYRKIPLFASLSERGYRWVAAHRNSLSFFDRLLWAGEDRLPSYRLAGWLFLRLLGAVYLIAFASLGTQVLGLIGEAGISPAAEFLTRVESAPRFSAGWDRFLAVPTLFLWGCSDTLLQAGCVIGAGLAFLFTLGVATPLVGVALWLLYLSFVGIGGDFLGFQWDNLLLEAGFMAIFLAPGRLKPHLAGNWSPPKSILLLFALLLFRLNVSSGVVKLQTEDATAPNTWQELTALNYHYETQPLPTALGWYAHQLPEPFQKTSVVAMFFVQLVLPFLAFAPVRLKRFGAIGMGLLQILILLTGNYCFFNLLTLGFCLLLLDDACLERFFPKRLYQDPLAAPRQHLGRWLARASLVVPAAILLGGLGLAQFSRTVLGPVDLPGPVRSVLGVLAPFRTIDTYGLFAHMTTSRPEIVIEGSLDGLEWKPYDFKYKPGPLDRAPVWIQPHQPRLDWQMWFAALGSYRSNPWFVSFMHCLLEGSPRVLALLAENPFPEKPPRYIRATLQDYHFTTPLEKRRTGNWWKAGEARPYFPQATLADFRVAG